MPGSGLTTASVIQAGAALADAVGLDQLGMASLAERLGVKTPSLYKHVTSQADLTQGIAVVATTELADAIRDATQGRAGRDALIAGAHAMRNFVRNHPGRYTAANTARNRGADDPLLTAGRRVMTSWTAMLHGYHLADGQHIYALRTLRGTLHDFATLEAARGFQVDTSVDDSFTWLVDFIDHGMTDFPKTRTEPAQHGNEVNWSREPHPGARHAETAPYGSR